jgi:hypothetical protein
MGTLAGTLMEEAQPVTGEKAGKVVVITEN